MEKITNDQMKKFDKHLSYVQNNKQLAYIDIMSITGLMNNLEKARHISNTITWKIDAPNEKEIAIREYYKSLWVLFRK